MRRALAGQVRQNQIESACSSACCAAAISAGTFSCPVSLAAQSRQEAALNITDIKCQRSGSAWQKLCTALSGLLRKPSLTAK